MNSTFLLNIVLIDDWNNLKIYIVSEERKTEKVTSTRIKICAKAQKVSTELPLASFTSIFLVPQLIGKWLTSPVNNKQANT